MGIFWMNTMEGNPIPFLRLENNILVRNLNSEDNLIMEDCEWYADRVWDEPTYHYFTHQETEHMFGATSEDLYQFATYNSLGSVINSYGRRVTLPPAEGHPAVNVIINPNSTIEDRNTFWFNYALKKKDGDPDKFAEDVLFETKGNDKFPESYFAISQRNGSLRGGPYSVGRYLNQGEAQVSVLVIDELHDIAIFTLRYIQQTETEGMPEPNKKYIGKVLAGTRNITYSTKGDLLTRDYWDAMTGTYESFGEGTEPPEGGGCLVDLSKRYAPTVSTSATGIYVLDKEQVTSFGMSVWNEGILDKLNVNINGKALDNLLDFKFYYGIKNDLQMTKATAYLSMGKAVFDGSWSSAPEVKGKALTSEYCQMSMGEISVPRKFGSFLDYEPYSKLQIYLPFYGFVDLSMSELVGRTLRLNYNINVISGATQITIHATKDGGEKKGWYLVAIYDGMLGETIAFNAASTATIASRVVGTLAGAGASLVAGSMNPIAGLVTAATTASNVLTPGAGSYQRSSTPSPASSSMGCFQPFIRIIRSVIDKPEGYGMMIGNPDNNITKLGSFTKGYLKIREAKFSNTQNIPSREMTELINLLKEGVWID